MIKELQISTNLPLRLAHSTTNGFYATLTLIKNHPPPPIPFGLKVVSVLELLVFSIFL